MNDTKEFLKTLKSFEVECKETQHTDTSTLWVLMEEAKRLLEKKRVVNIGVSGGVASVQTAPDDVDVNITDYD